MKEPNTDEPDFFYDTIREDGRLERTCKHGIGHTVGHIHPKSMTSRYDFAHGCDGCCFDYEIDDPNKVLLISHPIVGQENK